MKSMIFTLTLLLSAHAFAHEDHNHEAAVEAAPHGGILRDSPPYKVELVIKKEQTTIYVYDKQLKAVPKSRLAETAKARLAFPKDKQKREVVFKYVGESYQAKIPGIDKVHRYDLHVDLVIDGKTVLGDFGVDNIR